MEEEEGPSYHHPLLQDTDAISSDDSRLKQLGYKQELSRNLSAIENFSVTFSIVSVLTGLSTTFGIGLTYGGTITMVYGWPVVGMLTLVVGLSMAEICSAYPTSGGLYFWSAPNFVAIVGDLWLLGSLAELPTLSLSIVALSLRRASISTAGADAVKVAIVAESEYE
ncbi:hypothetical protein ACLB2K_042658 [Fragaria x ananassa]